MLARLPAFLMLARSQPPQLGLKPASRVDVNSNVIMASEFTD